MSCKSLKSHNNDNNKKTIFNIIYCERAKNDLFGKAYCKKKNDVATLYDQVYPPPERIK